jgi:hypothetical protein
MKIAEVPKYETGTVVKLQKAGAASKKSRSQNCQ